MIKFRSQNPATIFHFHSCVWLVNKTTRVNTHMYVNLHILLYFFILTKAIGLITIARTCSNEIKNFLRCQNHFIQFLRCR